MKLQQDYFARPTLKVAKDLIGKFLVRAYRGKIYSGMINETEAYIGEKDLACHASKGRTPRTEVLYAKPGILYVYLIYGMHHLLNIVTEREGFPAAVLIRGVEGVYGPGRLTKAFHIDRSSGGKEIFDCTSLGASPCKAMGHGDKIWVEDRGGVVPAIRCGPRIGIDYAGRWAQKPWRFYVP